MPSIAHANMLLLFPSDPQKLNSICLLRHLVQQESGNSSLYHQRQRILVGAVLTCSAGHGHVLGLGSGHVPLLLLRQQTEQLSGDQAANVSEVESSLRLEQRHSQRHCSHSRFLGLLQALSYHGKKHREVTGASTKATSHPSPGPLGHKILL